MPTALSSSSDEISVHLVKIEKEVVKPTPTLFLNQSETYDYPSFIHYMRSTGEPVYHHVLANQDKKLVENLCQTPLIGTVDVKDWGFPVRLNYDDDDFYVLVQRFKLCIVGFMVRGGGWILLKGSYRERVRDCVDTCFRVFDLQGNLIEPKFVDLGTSCSLLRKSSGVELTDLKFNKQAFINAVVYLRGASLGVMPFDKKLSALHVLYLSQMICKATMIKRMACHIDQHYFSDDCDTPSVTANIIEMQRLWTEASRKIAGWASGKDTETFQLEGNTLTVEQVIAMYPYTKGTTTFELECE
ncbi:hypothetical protein POM88_002124 [Heracleum sosnowskyi]|uniref:rRNA N-glycosylase n=1 Tax=Heracleum sosnowskyi TaxID=360622 RepID=A0AAD8JE69_9APIA|nr:hypothetical protein POM88_002123 [Heracleum sosnowskyi]KAK1402519.1 hypothetical protein POM88_002124 [Heracleum sosnowskyi]